MSKKPKVYVLPGAFDAKHGYCAKVVCVDDYEDIEFALSQERAAHIALRTIVKKLPNASAIIGDAHALAVKLGWVS